MKKRIAVVWKSFGFIEVDADSIEEAMNKFRKNPDDYSLPYDGGEYVEGSLSLSTNNVGEMKRICGLSVKEDMEEIQEVLDYNDKIMAECEKNKEYIEMENMYREGLLEI